ncbi:MAG: hypothetical protein JW909_14080 [Planctomycetes bacterium]|nr:hypothetical protein [Planctomycetota bacterium]
MDMPDVRFSLFGMGPRRKLLYSGGVLKDAFSAEVLGRWDVASDAIAPEDYTVDITTASEDRVSVFENEKGCYLSENGSVRPLSEYPVNLPSFPGHPYSRLLRILHQELLVNIVDAGPVPNLFVYPNPWYRDAAMVVMCLSLTGNIRLVEGWLRGLDSPYDRNNAGVAEPDNLGQVLYMLSMVSNSTHPVVDMVLDAVHGCREGRHIAGKTDFGDHPVYQTKWLKFGLRSMGLPDPYEIPAVPDPYSALFWMNFREHHVRTAPFSERSCRLYPYLAWAEAHFHGTAPDALPLGRTYPLTWEAESSEGLYDRMAVVDPEYAARRISPPHSWHAAEAFLYLLEAS